MGSLGSQTTEAAPALALELPPHYSKLSTDAKRMVDTLEESCTWGNTPDGGMSMKTPLYFIYFL